MFVSFILGMDVRRHWKCWQNVQGVVGCLRMDISHVICYDIQIGRKRKQKESRQTDIQTDRYVLQAG